jgi:acetyl-CoA synthetase
MSETNVLENQPVAWHPSDEVIEKAQLMRFMKQTGTASFDELYKKSIADVSWFTSEVLKFLEIELDSAYEQLLETSNGPEFPQWLKGARFNAAKQCVTRWMGKPLAEQPALIWEAEEGTVRTLTYEALETEVEACAAGFRVNGIGKGDAVGIHLPMMCETVVALIALARIGAIAVPVFSGYGVDAIASRLNAVEAKALITCDGFPRRGKPVDALSTGMEAAHRSPSVEKVFVVRRLNTNTGLPEKFIEWQRLMTDGAESDEKFKAIENTSAEDPLIILYTSGTTGKPKGIAHTHCSFPIKAAQDMAFGTDVGKCTRISWVTDIGWMMGPWLIYGTLILGGTIVIYDGAPDFPEADRMWEFCARHKVEILGISPTLIRALATKGDELPKKHDLSFLRAFASTGEPWNPAPWWWLFEKVGDSKLPIINYSGGTEIAGGILMGNPLLPIKPCSFPAPCLGMAAEILDENGKPSPDGSVGELAITEPWIGMARGFWKEPERYRETYWSRFDGIWVHGDWAMKDSDGHWFILGRSDDTLKVAGKRVGPAEVESLLVAHEKVTEAAVIGVPDEIKGTAMVAFCVLSGDAEIGLESELKELVAKDMGKPLSPSRIHFVNSIPKTRNAKVMRRVIRSAYLGEDAGDLSALENPASLEELRKLGKF